MADDDSLRKQVEERRATVMAWLDSGPGGIVAALFVLAIAVALALTTVGVL